MIQYLRVSEKSLVYCSLHLIFIDDFLTRWKWELHSGLYLLRNVGITILTLLQILYFIDFSGMGHTENTTLSNYLLPLLSPDKQTYILIYITASTDFNHITFIIIWWFLIQCNLVVTKPRNSKEIHAKLPSQEIHAQPSPSIKWW